MGAAEYDGFMVLSIGVCDGVGFGSGSGFEVYVNSIAWFIVVNIFDFFFDDGSMVGGCNCRDLSCVD